MVRGSRESLSFEDVEGKTNFNAAWGVKFNGFHKLLGTFKLAV